MRRLAYTLLVLLTLPALVMGQVTVTSGAAIDFSATNNWTGPQQFADGSVTVPSIAWTSDADGTGTGFYRRTTNEITITRNGVGLARFDSLGFALVAGQQIGWASGAITTSADTTINRVSAGVVQFGDNVNGAAVAQSLKAHDGITGTDIAGASLTLAPGKGTGAAVSGQVILNRDLVGATGTTAQTQGTAWVSCPSKILSNTTGTAQTIATITTTSTTAGAINMFYTVTASNGTVLDADSGEAQVAWNNNAGTVAATMAAAIGGANSAASGTLATTPTATFATNVVSIKFTPAWTVIVPTVVTGYATFAVNGVNSIACQ